MKAWPLKGGEELMMVLPGIVLPGAGLAVVERIRLAAERNGRIRVSPGADEWKPGDEDFNTAVAVADKALYRAKGDGRNRVAGDPPATGVR